MVGNPSKLTIGDAILVVAHEDMWSSNIMTHRREDGNWAGELRTVYKMNIIGTMEISIVDHQFPEVDTPSVDIVFFIFCSMAVADRRKHVLCSFYLQRLYHAIGAHMKELFQVYAETFAAASEEYPSSEQVMDDITSRDSLRRGAAKAIGMMIGGERCSSLVMFRK